MAIVSTVVGRSAAPDRWAAIASHQIVRLTAKPPKPGVGVAGRAPVAAGAGIDLAIDPTQLHLFDCETGDALPLAPVAVRSRL